MNERGGKLFVRATRAKVVPLILAPVALGAVVAWERFGVLSWWRLAVSLAAAAAMHLAANVVNDVYDEESGAEVRARADHKSLATGSGVMGAGLMSKKQLLTLAGTMFGGALVAGIALAATGRPHALTFGAIGFVLAHQYVGPPLRYAVTGRGLGEIGIFVSFGVLPVAGSSYVQSGVVDAAAIWASVVPGLLITLVLYHHHFLHWESDRAVGKMSPVAALKPPVAMALGRVVLIATVLVLAAQTLLFGLFPPGGFAAAIAAAPVFVAQATAAEEPGNEAYVRLLGASLGAVVLASGILIVAEIVRVAIR